MANFFSYWGLGVFLKGGRLHYAWIILAVGVLGVTGALGLGRFGYTVILPSMKEGLNLNYTQMGLIGTANLIGYLIFSLLGGFFASRFQPKIVIVISLTVETLTLYLTGMVTGFFGVLLARAVTGMGSAGANVPIMGLASAWFSPLRRGLAAGILVAGSGIGVLFTGLFIPGIISSHGADGWRFAWYNLALLTLLITFLCQLIIKNSPSEVGLCPFGTEEKSPVPPNSPEDIKWAKVYKNRSLWQLGFVYFAFGFSYIIYATFFSAHTMRAGNLNQAAAGAIWSVVGLISLVSGVIWGGISDKIGRQMALFMVFLLHAFSYFVFAISTTKTGFYISALAFGVSAWSIPSIVAAFAGDLVGAKLAPAALGKVTVTFGIGQALGPYVAGFLTDTYDTFSYAFLLAALVAFGGGIGALFLKKDEPLM